MQTRHRAPGRKPGKIKRRPRLAVAQAANPLPARDAPPAPEGSAMSALGLRWMSPATAAAYLELRELAPRLSGLLYSQTIPDSVLQEILDWSDAVAASDETSPFEVDRLQALMPALVVAFIAEHSYACAGPEGIGGCIDLYYEGCGQRVGRRSDLARTT